MIKKYINSFFRQKYKLIVSTCSLNWPNDDITSHTQFRASLFFFYFIKRTSSITFSRLLWIDAFADPQYPTCYTGPTCQSPRPPPGGRMAEWQRSTVKWVWSNMYDIWDPQY